MKTLDFRDLKIWEANRQMSSSQCFPPSNNRPNPPVVQDTLRASVFSEQSSKYPEAADLLVQAGKSTTLKSDWFRYWLASARLAKRVGRDSDAAEFAEKALAIAASKEPQFKRHPNVGKVVIDMSIQHELEQLRASNSL